MQAISDLFTLVVGSIGDVIYAITHVVIGS